MVPSPISSALPSSNLQRQHQCCRLQPWQQPGAARQAAAACMLAACLPSQLPSRHCRRRPCCLIWRHGAIGSCCLKGSWGACLSLHNRQVSPHLHEHLTCYSTHRYCQYQEQCQQYHQWRAGSASSTPSVQLQSTQPPFFFIRGGTVAVSRVGIAYPHSAAFSTQSSLSATII